MMIYGVDVSEADGNVDWQQMKKNGLGFAMLCAGYGSGSVDLQFRKNAENCGRLGIPFGAYWHSYAYTLELAEREAVFCMETIEEFELSFPLCVKYNYGSSRYAKSKGVEITEELVEEMAKAFCKKIEEAGYVSAYYVELRNLGRVFGT